MMRQLRLLALSTSYPLRKDADAGVFIRRLYEHLPDFWHVVVVCPDDTKGAEGDGAERLVVRPASYAPRKWQALSQEAGGIVPALRRNRLLWLLLPGLLVSMSIQCARAARKADVIHANWAICGAIAGLVGSLWRRPLVTTLRGDDVTASAGSDLHRWLLGAALRRSDRVVCVSEPMAGQLRNLYPQYAGKISVCLNGVGEEFLRVERTPIQPGLLRIVVVASLIHRKALDVVLEAMSLARGRHGMTLHVAGDGPEREALVAQAARSGLSAQVTFGGQLPPQDVPGVLSRADIYVMSSRSEGRPNVVIEALASGLPVITTDLPGNAGLVEAGKNGWVVPIDDAPRLAQALDLARDEPARRLEMGRAAREGITARGETWHGAAQRYDEVFRDLIAEAGAVRS